MVTFWTHPDRAPTGTCLTYLVGYNTDPTADDFEVIVGIARSHAEVPALVLNCTGSATSRGFSTLGLYLRGRDEPYAVCPEVSSLYVLSIEPGDAYHGGSWTTVSQFAFVDRDSAEAYLAEYRKRHDLGPLTIRELSIGRPLLSMPV